MIRVPRVAVLLAFAVFGLAAQPRVWQDTVTLPTYPEAAPDPEPALEALTTGRFWYPYTTRNPLAAHPTPQVWRRVNLENEYLACTFLPDLGGRLYSCIDKLNRHPLFYANPVVKRGLGEIRNAFAASGVEPNFPVAHSRDSTSPVDFAFRQEKDLATVWMSTTDRVTGMRWVTKFILRAGRAVLEENVTLSNPTSVRHPYYWWNNAEVAIEPGSRFIVPTNVVATHGRRDLESWPVSDGIDRSVIANLKNQTALFAYQCREPFLGIYYGRSKTATLHVADPAIVSGKKIWAWGSSDEKGQAALVDDGTHLAEIQAGLFADQETYQFLPPHSARTFTEYWLPARGLDGISRATADAVLNFSHTAGAISIEINVTRAIPHARIRILRDSTPALEQSADLKPDSVFTRSIPSPAAGAYRVALLDQQGRVLLAHAEAQQGEAVYAAAQASSVKLGPQPAPASTPEDSERAGRLQAAENALRASLKQSPQDAQLKKSLGRLLVVRGNFAEAAALLAAAPPDAETRYYLGVALAAQGHEAEARRNLQLVAADPAFGAAATIERAASESRSRNKSAALALIQAVVKAQPELLEAGRLQIALLRNFGMIAVARAQLAHWQSAAPYDSFLRLESVRLIGPDAALWPHLAADPGRVLDLADTYFFLGMYGDSLAALNHPYDRVPPNQTEPGRALPQNDPLVVYYRAFARQELKWPAAADWKAAPALPLDYIFPHRPSSFAVLAAALRANPADASAHWLLGLLELDAGLSGDAIAQWQQARALPAHIPTLRPLLAQALRQLKNDPAAAEAVAREGAKIAPAEAKKAIESALNAPAAVPKTLDAAVTPDGVAALALMRAASGDLSGGLGLFTSAHFPQEHESDEVRRAYIELQLLKLRALAGEHKCDPALRGVDALGNEDKALPFTLYGFDRFMKGARFQFYLAGVESACGDQKSARKLLEKVSRMTAPANSADFVFPALSLFILEDRQAQPRLQADLQTVRSQLAKTPPESQGLLLYSAGMLLRTLGQEQKAAPMFAQGAKAPNIESSEYLNTLARMEKIVKQ